MACVSTVKTKQSPVYLESKKHSQHTTYLEDLFTQFDNSISISPLNSTHLRASIDYNNWSGNSLLFCHSTPLTITWSQNCNQEKRLYFYLFRVFSGSYRVICQGKLHTFDSDDHIAILSNNDSVKIIFDQPTLFVLMSFLRKSLPLEMYNLDKMPFYKIDRQNFALDLLNAYQDFLRGKKSSSDSSLAQKVGQHLSDLMSVCLVSALNKDSTVQRTGREAWLETIKADIQANLGQVRLSAKTAAQRHGVTDRYIHKLFEETGETFGRYVTEQRLKRAYKLLTRPNYTVPISTIALEVGFGELSTFNRAFKRRFGETPSAIRRKHNARQSVVADQQNHDQHQNFSKESSA